MNGIPFGNWQSAIGNPADFLVIRNFEKYVSG
jgi:hypothetical protein